MVNEANAYKSKMQELEHRLKNSKKIRKKIVDLSKRSYIDARECSNNTDALVVPSSISANIIPDSEGSSVFSPQPVTNKSEPITDVQDNKSSLEEISKSEPEYKNL